MVLLYFLFSLSIQLVVYNASLYFYGEVHVREVSCVTLRLIPSQGWVLLFPFGHKSNEMFVSLQGFHLFVLQGEHFAKFLGHSQLILMGYATKYLSLDMCHTELVCCLRKAAQTAFSMPCSASETIRSIRSTPPFLQRLKLLLPAYGPFRRMIDYGEHFPASVLQHPQHGIVSLFAYLPVPAGGDKGGVYVDG